MKAIFRLLFIMALSLTFCLAVYAHDFEVDGIYYENTSYGEAGVTYRGSSNADYANEYSGKVVIPATVTYNNKTLNVTSIGGEAFMNCTELTDVVMPNSVVTIGSEAFSGCTGLVSIDIPEGVTQIHTKAFWHCTNLALVSIPESVSLIGRSAFGQTPFYINKADGVIYLGRVLYEYKGEVPQNLFIKVPDNIVSISDYAFQNRKGLAAITFPESLERIGYSAFDGCTGLTEITIPKHVTLIDTYAFKDCHSLMTVNYNAVDCSKELGDDIFKSCGSLTEVNIGDEVLVIPRRLFYNCSSINDLSMGSSVTEIHDNAFYGTSIANVTLPETLITIENGAFAATNLTEITIPCNVTTIGKAFSACDRLSTLNYNAIHCTEYAMNNTIEILNIGGMVKVLPEKLVADCEKLRNVTIPESVTEISFRAFYMCKGLTELAIPSSIVSIDSEAFRGCSGLEKIVVDEANTIYDSRNNCNAIIETQTNKLLIGCKETIIPEDIVTIGTCAFADCTTLTAITVPNSVTQIDGNAFSGCTGLTEFTIPQNIKQIKINAFQNCSNMAILYYNAESCEASDGFENCYFIKKAYIGDSVKTLPKSLFEKCSGLTDVIFGKNVTEIGASVFYQCTSLTNVVLPEGLKVLSEQTFYGCSSLPTVILPEGMTEIGVNAFYKCTNLKTITLPSTLTELGKGAFYECKNLSSISLPEGITTLKSKTFYNCATLSAVLLPSGLTTIEDAVFYNSKNMAEIKISAAIPPVIQSNTFRNVVKTIPLYVPKGSKEAYQSAQYWSEFTNIIEMNIQPASLMLDSHELSMYVAQQAQLTATILPESTLVTPLLWISSDDAIATVDDAGVVTAHKEGSAVITVATTDGSNLCDSCRVTVNPKLVETIALDKENVVAIVGDTVTITATINPQDATDQRLLWEVSDATVVDMEILTDVSVQVVILREGVATITARTIDGSNLSACCNINIYSGINNATTDTQEVEYYDLSGRHVLHPEHGVYIVRSGGVVRKVVL